MNKSKVIEVALWIIMAIEGGVTAYEVRRIARNGFEVQLTEEQAEEIAEQVNEAHEAQKQAEEDMCDD